MSGSHEQSRQFDNSQRKGTVVETKSHEGVLLAKVKISDRVTDWLPVQALVNEFIQVFIPVIKGEQVYVFSEFGNADSGIIIRSFAFEKQKAPKGNLDQMIVHFKDGTEFIYDSKAKKMSLLCAGELFIEAESVTIDAPLGVRSTLQVDDDITTNGEISDSRGDLTNFTTTDGASRS